VNSNAPTDMDGASKSDSGSTTSLSNENASVNSETTDLQDSTQPSPADDTPMTLDELMALDPLELAKSPEAIDAIIAYHRNNRARAEAGIKPQKDEGPKVKIDLEKLGLGKPKSIAPSIKRRI